jgi:hypothetical protein
MVRLPVRKTAPDLGGVYLELDRAETHLETFRKEAATFSERDRAPFVQDRDTPRSDKSVEYVLYNLDKHRLLVPIIAAVDRCPGPWNERRRPSSG